MAIVENVRVDDKEMTLGTYTETEMTMDMDDTRSGRVYSGRVGAREHCQWEDGCWAKKRKDRMTVDAG